MQQKKTVKTQARSLESQQAVIDAVIELIAEEGFSSTSTANIEKRAGVSWGVLQYHFGGKRQIFEAVLRSTTGQLKQAAEDLLADPPATDEPLKCAIDRLWKYYSAASYRAGMEILLNHAHLESDLYRIGRDAHDTLTKFFRRLFRSMGYRCSTKASDSIAEFIICTLRGMAVGNALFPKKPRNYAVQRDMLAQVATLRLSSALQPASRPAARKK